MARQKETLAIDIANAKSLADFLASYLPPDTSWASFTHPESRDKYTIELQTSSALSVGELEACFALIEESSKVYYAASKTGWKPVAKRKEMRLLDLKYLLIRAPKARDDREGERRGEVMGFVSFMPTVEDECEVLYIYEIHLDPALRGSGLGKQLMGLVEGVAERIEGVEKVMLTSFTGNERAKRFYEALGYGRDAFSPMPRVLRDGRVVEEAYVILSKAVEREEVQGIRG